MEGKAFLNTQISSLVKKQKITSHVLLPHFLAEPSLLRSCCVFLLKFSKLLISLHLLWALSCMLLSR